MRLYNTYYLCKKCIDDIEALCFTLLGKLEGYEIDNWTECKEAMTIIRQIPFLKESVDILYNTIPVFVREEFEPRIDGTVKNRVSSARATLIHKMQTVIELYETLNIDINEHGIDVKVPSCSSIKEYIVYLKELDFIFSQCPFLQHKDVEIKFRAVDVGSQWLTFIISAVAGTAAVGYVLSNLALMVDKSLQILSHFHNLKQQEEILRNQKLQNEVLESNIKSFDLLRSYYLSEAVKEIENMNEESTLENGEERGKAEKSLEKLCDLLDKGVEIYASIDTNREIQILFPALSENAELPDNVLKLLEDKKEG